MSLVESWPSTRHAVERARDAHAEQQVGGLGAQSGVGLDEAEHRRERRRDHPRALGLRGQPHGAGRQRDVDLDLLGELVRRLDRLGEVAVPVLAELAASTRDPADRVAGVEQHADHAGRGHRDLVLADAAGHRRRALHPGRLLEAAPPGRRVRVAGVGHDHPDRVQPRAFLGQHDGRGEHAGAREPRRADAFGLRAHQQAEVHPAARLEAAGHARGAEATGQLTGVLGDVLRDLQPTTHNSASLSGRPNIRLRFWTACEAAPFHRLSIAAKTMIRPVRGSWWSEIRQ